MRPPDWTAKEIDRLRELAAEGLSSEEIASRLGKTKNSIIGAARRRGIPLLYRQYDNIPPWPESPKTRTDLRSPVAGHYSIIDLRSENCRWPEGERAPYRFCGRPAAEGGPYCRAHAAIAFNRPGVRAA